MNNKLLGGFINKFEKHLKTFDGQLFISAKAIIFCFLLGAILVYIFNFGVKIQFLEILILVTIITLIIRLTIIVFKNYKSKDIDDIIVADKNIHDIAASYVALIGGKQNIEQIESNANYINLVLKNNINVDEKALKAIGAIDIIKVGNRFVKISLDSKTDLIVDEIKKIIFIEV